ncbi:MAG TPA: NFACT family protein [Terriglobia bacterium]|jgi:predicted ribosome quality control (RQC) complex YloA/Tae2 family protein
MENFALIALVESLRPAMSELIIRRVIQHHPSGFILQTRSVKLPAIKIVADMQRPVLYPSEKRPLQESPGTDFLMVLRKHLTSAEVTGFSKRLSERIVEFSFKTAVPSKELETMSLIVELLPNAPNLILLDAERRVVSSFLDLTPQHGIGEYDTYAYPAQGEKLELERILEDDPPPLNDLTAESLISRVAGIGPVFARELALRQKKSGKGWLDEIRTLLEQARAPSHAAWLYTELPLGHILEQNDLRRLQKAILSPIELESLSRTHSARLFVNILEATRFYYDEFETRTLLEQAKLPILRDMRQVSKRFADREKRLVREQQKYQQAEGLQKTAQMLTSSGKDMEQHYPSVKVTDYFGEQPATVEVDLDSAISLRENIEKLFKQYQKAGRGKSIVARQLGELRNKRATIEEQTKRLEAIKDWDTWMAISSKIPVRGAPPAPQKEAGTASGRRFRSIEIDGREVLIGKGARENDELTFDIAAPEDFWFHVADYSGSHVVVRNPVKDKNLDETVLVKAAQLAAYFSQARNSSKVEVHYTKRKHVTKVRRAKPGLVRLLEFKSIKVEPKNWLE